MKKQSQKQEFQVGTYFTEYLTNPDADAYIEALAGYVTWPKPINRVEWFESSELGEHMRNLGFAPRFFSLLTEAINGMASGTMKKRRRIIGWIGTLISQSVWDASDDMPTEIEAAVKKAMQEFCALPEFAELAAKLKSSYEEEEMKSELTRVTDRAKKLGYKLVKA